MMLRTKPWLPCGFEFLSGLPEAKRKGRLLMPVQVFVDDSGGKGHSRNLVLVGLGADAEMWAAFSTDWEKCLKAEPSINLFKMHHAANLTGEFRGWSSEARDEKLKSLASVINQYARLAIFAGFDLEAHQKTWEKALGHPMKDCYFFAFYVVVLGFTFQLWEYGLRERFEIIYDEQAIFGPRFKYCYPVLRETLKIKGAKEYGIMPVEPMFKKDDEFLPLQASDLYAWCFRRNTDNPEEKAFEWLLPHLSNIKGSDYISYYDEERMQSVLAEANENLKNGIPKELQDAYKKLYGK